MLASPNFGAAQTATVSRVLRYLSKTGGVMIEVGVVDLSAEGRRRLAALLERWSWVSPESGGASLPRLSLRLLSHEEVRFHGGLNLCIVGPELIASDLAMVAAIRRSLPDRPLLCVLDSRTYSIAMVEQLSRLMVDDVLTETASSDDFYRRVILLGRKAAQRQRGSLVVVDSARGGVGVTLITAALGEMSASSGKKVCLVDTDAFSQDLTRFLQCRPFVSEALKLLLDNQRVPTADTLSECVCRVWEDEPNLYCVPPPAASDQAAFAASGARAFTGVLESLQSVHDLVIVDASPLPTSLRQILYQVSDAIAFVANRDPAGAYANRQALSVVLGFARRDARVSLLINDSTGHGLPGRLLARELAADSRLHAFESPFSRRAARWPCSGATAALALRASLEPIATFLEGNSASDGSSVLLMTRYLFLRTQLAKLRNWIAARIRVERATSVVPRDRSLRAGDSIFEEEMEDGLVSRPTWIS